MAFVVGGQFAIQGLTQLDPQQLIVPLGCAPYERRVPIVQSEFPENEPFEAIAVKNRNSL
jgi:hypothetical protein